MTPHGRLGKNFAARQEAHLGRTGRINATASSRVKHVLAEQEGTAEDDCATVVSTLSHTPSLHPSMTGTIISEACSRETIGAGDATKYWEFQVCHPQPSPLLV